MRIWLLNIVLGVGLLAWLTDWTPPVRQEVSGWFPQNQDCQSEADALRIRFPYQPSIAKRYSSLVPDPEASVRSVTNCHRFGFRFFAANLEITHLHYVYISGDIATKFYATNSDKVRDVVVHVELLQPATSILDPTISTNRHLLFFAHDLQRARSRFSGARKPLDGYDLDTFSPYEFQLQDRFFFISRAGIDPEQVGECVRLDNQGQPGQGICQILVFSQKDALAFALKLPYAELGRLHDIVDRTLALIRNWRV